MFVSKKALMGEDVSSLVAAALASSTTHLSGPFPPATPTLISSALRAE